MQAEAVEAPTIHRENLLEVLEVAVKVGIMVLMVLNMQLPIPDQEVAGVEMVLLQQVQEDLELLFSEWQHLIIQALNQEAL